jgi:imidazoleglycerol-phosphate dehydratase
LRRARIDRRTAETQIQLVINLDGAGRFDVRTGIRFLDHMLELVARHGVMDLQVEAKGDLDVTCTTRWKTSASLWGRQCPRRWGSKRGICRAGYFVMPMDESLAVAAIDLSGRPLAVVDLKTRARLVGDLPVELVEDFFQGFAMAARANVHLKTMYGRSSHHQIEAVFKAFGRALRTACSRDRRLKKQLPSTKGLL